MTRTDVIIDRWERQTAEQIREAALAALEKSDLDEESLASRLGVMPSTAAALLGTTLWTMSEALFVADALGLEVAVTVKE